MSEPTKEYQARIWVRLTDELLPAPVLSRTEVEERLKEALGVGSPDSDIVGVAVSDRSSGRRR